MDMLQHILPYIVAAVITIGVLSFFQWIFGGMKDYPLGSPKRNREIAMLHTWDLGLTQQTPEGEVERVIEEEDLDKNIPLKLLYMVFRKNSITFQHLREKILPSWTKEDILIEKEDTEERYWIPVLYAIFFIYFFAVKKKKLKLDQNELRMLLKQWKKDPGTSMGGET